MATASPRSDALAPPGSVGQVSNRQAKPLLRKKDDLHVTYWNVRTLQDVGEDELIKDFLLPTPPRKRTGGQLKT